MKKIYVIALLAVCFSTAINALVPPEGIYQMAFTVESTSPTPIYQATLAPIATSGYYALSENITGEIQISANNVTLDLNGYTVESAAADAITVDAGLNNIVIKNGTAKAPGNNGLFVDNTTTNWIVRDCIFTGCQAGIVGGNSVSSFVIENCLIENCSSVGLILSRPSNALLKDIQVSNVVNTTADGGATGIQIANLATASPGLVFENCHVCDIECQSTNVIRFAVGFNLFGLRGAVLRNCSASNIRSTADATAYGFQCGDCDRTILENCHVSNIVSTSTDSAYSAAGFRFLFGSADCMLTNCSVTKVEVPDAASPAAVASAYGVHCDDSDRMVLESVEVREISTSSLVISSSARGFYFVDSDDCRSNNCSAFSIISSPWLAGAQGWYADSCDRMVLEGCLVSDVSTQSTNPAVVADGFRLANSDDCTLNNCQAIKIDASTGSSAYGVYVNESLRAMLEDCNVVNVNALNDVVGYAFFSSSNNGILNNCSATRLLAATGAAYGVYTISSENILMDGITVNNISSRAETGGSASGVQLFSNYGIVRNSTVYDIDATATDALAFGIRSLDGLVLNDDLRPGDTIRSIDWHPTGNWIAICYNDGANITVRVHSFDGSAFTLVHGSVIIGPSSVNVVKWSPDGQYLAVGFNSGGDQLYVFPFDGTTFGTPITQSVGNNVRDLDWHPSGNYIAVVDTTTLGANGKTYSFDGTSLTSLNTFGLGVAAYAVAWHPSGRYIAIAGQNEARVFTFLPLTGVLSLAGPTLTTGGGRAESLGWSAEGNVLAATTTGPTDTLIAYSFDPTLATPFAYLDMNSDFTSLRQLAWHPTASYIAVVGAGDAGGYNTAVFVLDNGGLRRIAGFDIARTGYAEVAWQKRSPYVITFAGTNVAAISLQAYNNLTSNCIVESNLVNNVQTPWGRGYGYVVSPTFNMLDRNEAYLNDINYNGNIADVYVGGMNGMPSLIQNVSL